jgi:hypothetical protein
MSIKLVDFDKLAAQVANDLFYRLIGEPADLYEEDGVTWEDALAVIQRLPEGQALYGIIAREFDTYNMVTFGVLEINSQADFDAMQQEMNRLRRSWFEQFGYEDPFCAAGAYATAEKGLLG